MLEQLDQVWDAPSPEVRKQIEAAAQSNDALIRQAAVEALGRLGAGRSPKLLGDPSKLVQRTAAWAMRQAYSRHPDTPSADITTALASADDRTRWGATRVFAPHFAALGKRPEMAAALEKLIDDPADSIRMQAVKGLWQFWFWAPDEPTKSAIEDTILTALGKPQPAWVESNLREAVYNLADENIRYLYNNWVPLLGRQEDRDRAIRGRLGVESRLAAKFADVLEKGSDAPEEGAAALRSPNSLCAAATSTIWRPISARPRRPVYNRIGNDIEQIAFFGASRRPLRAGLDAAARFIRRRNCAASPRRPPCWSATAASARSTRSPAPWARPSKLLTPRSRRPPRPPK